MHLFVRALSIVFALILGQTFLASCASGGVKYTALDPSLELAPRPSGCHIDNFTLGREATHQYPFLVTGNLLWSLKKTQIDALGPDGLQKKIHDAACSNGLFLVSDITAYPNTQTGGMSYEAKGAVLVDEDGLPLNVVEKKSTNTETAP